MSIGRLDMSNHIPCTYPLQWPANKPRCRNRDFGRYTKKRDGFGVRDVTLAEAQARLFEEIDKFNSRNYYDIIDPFECELRTMLEVRKDARIRQGQKKPPDPGAVLFMPYQDGKEMILAIDKFTELQQNIAAIAAALASLRQLQRVDAELFNAAAVGFAALPPPSVVATPNWRTVLGFKQDASPSIDEVRHNFHVAGNSAHPDKGGNSNVQSDLNRAFAEAKEELRS